MRGIETRLPYALPPEVSAETHPQAAGYAASLLGLPLPANLTLDTVQKIARELSDFLGTR